MPKKRKALTPATKKRWKKLALFYGMTCCVAGMLAGGVYLMFFSQIPHVQSWEVEGMRHLGRAEVLGAVGAVLEEDGGVWKRMLGREHVLFWTSGEIQGAESFLPELERAFVERSVLKRRVQIKVMEQEARGVWCVPEGACFVFNEAGILFAKAPDVYGYLVTKVVGEEAVPLAVGDRVMKDRAVFQNIQETIQAVEDAGVQVKEAFVTSRERKEWAIETADGARLLFSLGEAPENIGIILEELENQRGWKGVQEIDFRVPEKIYIR